MDHLGALKCKPRPNTKRLKKNAAATPQPVKFRGRLRGPHDESWLAGRECDQRPLRAAKELGGGSARNRRAA